MVPSASVDADASNRGRNPVSAGVWRAKAAVGATFVGSVTVVAMTTVVLGRPRSSSTVRLTVYVPAFT
jgi:hypothetical protein